MDQPLTVVLPVHNRERQLRSSVQDILDLVQTIRRPMQIVIVDDGSTDDTYETACELAQQYPQLHVFRQSIRQGVGAALELVRNRLAVEMVLVHDGVSIIDATQLQNALQTDDRAHQVVQRAGTTTESAGSRRFSAVRALHNQMEQVHRLATSFRWIQLERPMVPRRRHSAKPAPSMPAEMISGNVTVTLPQLPLGAVPTSHS